MKGTVVAFGKIDDRHAAALIRDGRLDDLFIDNDAPAPGTIFRGVCDRPVKGAGGMFIRLPEGQRGYMREAKGLKPGQAVLVQVTGYAEPGKAMPVTPRVIFKSRYAIITPGAPGLNISRRIKDEEERVRLKEIAHDADLAEGFGLILRSQCAGADDAIIAEDIAAMADAASKVMGDDGTDPDCLLDAPDALTRGWNDWPEPDLPPGDFADYGVDEMIAAMRDARVSLGHATAFIEPTRAMVAVDVNTGADTSPAAGLKANIALARDLPRQLRCRGLGGQIVLDVAPMPKKDRRQFETVLRAAFKSDPVDTVLAGWTPLGHFELQRKRERLPLT